MHSASSPGPGTPDRRRGLTPLQWVGLVMFLTPFLAVPLAMLGVGGGAVFGGRTGAAAGIAGFGLVPCTFIIAFVGLALMFIGRVRRTGAQRGDLLDVEARADGSGRHRSMRGDMPGENDVDYPDDATGRRPAPRREYVNPDENDLANPAGPTRDAVRCRHCGVYSAPGEQVCARCGAML